MRKMERVSPEVKTGRIEQVLSSKLNVASSVTLKQVFYSA